MVESRSGTGRALIVAPHPQSARRGRRVGALDGALVGLLQQHATATMPCCSFEMWRAGNYQLGWPAECAAVGKGRNRSCLQGSVVHGWEEFGEGSGFEGLREDVMKGCGYVFKRKGGRMFVFRRHTLGVKC